MTSKQRRKLTEFLFLLPTLLAFVMVIIIPFIYGIFYSFTDWQGTGSFTKMVGFENYDAIFKEPAFLHSFLKTLEFTVINIITVNVVAFIISLLVTSEIRGRNVYRAGFFVPNLIGGIVLGLIWQFIFSNILPAVGQAIGWDLLSKSLISNKDTVMFTMVTVNTWQYAGYIMLIYVAAIQSISKSVMLQDVRCERGPDQRRPRGHLYEQARQQLRAAGPEHLPDRLQVQQHGPGPGQGRAVLRGAHHLLHHPGIL